MPFFRASGGAGGGGVAECLANLNERIETLGQDEFLFFGKANPDQYEGEKKTISGTYTSMGVNADTGGLVIIDCSKLTYSHIQLSPTSSIYAITERGGDWEGKMFVNDVNYTAITNFATYSTKYIFIVIAPSSNYRNIQIRAYN